MKKNEVIPKDFYDYGGTGVIRLEINNQSDKTLEVDVLDFANNSIYLPIKYLEEDKTNISLAKIQIQKEGISIGMIGFYAKEIEKFFKTKIKFKNEEHDCGDYCNPSHFKGLENKLLMPIDFSIHKKEPLLVQVPPKTNVGVALYLK